MSQNPIEEREIDGQFVIAKSYNPESQINEIYGTLFSLHG